MFVIFLCVCIYLTIISFIEEKKMEELQQEFFKLNSEVKLAENMNHEIQDLIKCLELEKQEQEKRITITKKKHELEVSRLTEKISELESTIQELKEKISDLKKVCLKETVDENINVTTSNSEEVLMRLQAEKEEVVNVYSELQKANEESQAQNTNLEKERDELSMRLSELQSRLALKLEAYNESKENLKCLQEENVLMKIELETLKGQVDKHLSKGNSLFAEVEDGRVKLQKQITKHNKQLVTLEKHCLQTSLTLRRLLKQKARLCEDLAQAKEQVSTEELQLNLTAYKERLKDLETAQRAWVEEKAAFPVVLGNNYESIKKFDHLVNEEREKSKKIWERYEDIMMRYIAMTDEAVALRSEAADMERMKLRAEAEIVKLKQEIEKKGEGDSKGYELIPAVEKSPLQEIQNKKKCRFAPETIEPSSRKLVAKKETNKIPYLTSS